LYFCQNRKTVTHPYTKISVIGLIVILLLLSSCTISESEDVSESPVIEPSEIFEEGIIIWFFERTTIPELRLMMRTQGKFKEFSIDFEVVDSHTDSEFTREIIIKGLRKNTGVSSSEPARVTSHISFLDIEENLTLLIRDGPITDSFNVDISVEKVDISVLDTTFTEVSYDRYYRRPTNSMYFSCYTIEAKKHLCEELHELMKADANLREFQFPDDGVIPYPKQSLRSSFDYNAPIRYYMYHSSEDYKHAGQLLRDFADENGVSNEDNWLYIVNWQELAYSSYYMIF